MRVLLLGSGGRESAMATALSRSSSVEEIVAAPGNPGMAQVADTASIDICEPAAVVDLARLRESDLVVVGPEAPLVSGVADALRAEGIAVFGPSQAAARIEGSKWFAKKVMERAGIPTASGRAFSDPAAAVDHMDSLGPPYVIKADGLAAGKGVLVTTERDDAIEGIRHRLVDGRFGDAGRTVVIEEHLDGDELSVIAFTDGHTVLCCPPARDYKRAFDGDRGPNTGGMGSYSPVPSCSGGLEDAIAREVVEPMVGALSAAGTPFVGAIYAGLALTEKGPKVIEFNARFGDPETQALLPRLSSDFAEACLASASGELAGTQLEWSDDVCVAVVMAADGYPGPHDTGLEINGLEDAERLEGVDVFHAGTALRNGTLVTAGGRVLAVCGRGKSFGDARRRAYRAAALVSFAGRRFRSDIAEREETAER